MWANVPPIQERISHNRILSDICGENFSCEEAVDRVLSTDPYLRAAVNELSENPELLDTYRSIVLDGNRAELERKTLKQIHRLRDIYFCESTPDLSPSAIDGIDLWKIVRGRMKLLEFSHIVNRMVPIRWDDNEEIQEFSSPERMDMWHTRNLDTYDLLVRAQRYVYGSFDLIQHIKTKRARPRKIDEGDIENRAEIVMVDIASFNYGEKNIQRYVDNIFDYRQWKELLSAYFACIFDTPEEAFVWLWSRENKWAAERWWTEHRDPPILMEDVLVGNELFDAEKIHAAIATINEKGDQIYHRMLAIYNQTGITPPLNLEVRIRDSAKIVS